jgi:hypothetical protein
MNKFLKEKHNFANDDQDVGSLLNKQNNDLDEETNVWQNIESIVRTELHNNFYIDSLKEFLEQNNLNQVSKSDLIKATAPSLGQAARKSDFDVIIDYLIIYEILSQES